MRAAAKTRTLLLAGLLCAGCPGTEGDLLLRVPTDLSVDMTALPQCVTDVLGDSVQCETETIWKDRATQACNAVSGVVQGAGAFDPCGTNMFYHLKYACCPKSPMGSCVGELQGGESSCKDEATWKANAALSCKAAGAVAQDYMLSEPCGDGVYRYVKYLCCPPK